MGPIQTYIYMEGSRKDVRMCVENTKNDEGNIEQSLILIFFLNSFKEENRVHFRLQSFVLLFNSPNFVLFYNRLKCCVTF